MENLELETLLLACTSSISFTVVFGILFAIGLFAFSLLPINKYVMPWRQYIKRAFIKRDILIEYEEKNLLRWGSVEGSVFYGIFYLFISIALFCMFFTPIIPYLTWQTFIPGFVLSLLWMRLILAWIKGDNENFLFDRELKTEKKTFKQRWREFWKEDTNGAVKRKKRLTGLGMFFYLIVLLGILIASIIAANGSFDFMGLEQSFGDRPEDDVFVWIMLLIILVLPLVSALFFLSIWILFSTLMIPQEKRFQAYREAKVIELEKTEIGKNTQRQILGVIQYFSSYLMVFIMLLFALEVVSKGHPPAISAYGMKNGVTIYMVACLLSIIYSFRYSYFSLKRLFGGAFGLTVSRDKDTKNYLFDDLKIAPDDLYLITNTKGIFNMYIEAVIDIMVCWGLVGITGIFSVIAMILCVVMGVVEGYFLWKNKNRDIT